MGSWFSRFSTFTTVSSIYIDTLRFVVTALVRKWIKLSHTRKLLKLQLVCLLDKDQMALSSH